MNYSFFSQLDADPWVQADGESGQGYMERILAAVCSDDPAAPEVGANSLMSPRFHSCSAARHTLCLCFQVQDWMRNPAGNLHGGMSATMLDITMGLLTRYFQRAPQLATIQMSVNYLRPIPADSTVLVRAQLQKQGRQISFLSAEICTGEELPPAVTATASFMRLH